MPTASETMDYDGSDHISERKKRKRYHGMGSQESPIIIDDPDPVRDVDRLLPVKKRRGKNLQKQPQSSPEPAHSLRRHGPSVQQFGTYDDILTDITLDNVCYGGVIRKYSSTYASTLGNRDGVKSILRKAIISDKNCQAAGYQLLEMAGLSRFFKSLSSPEQKLFRQHMRRYLNLYLPDCAFEFLGTNRYTRDIQEAKIVCRKTIGSGETIKYLTGIRIHYTDVEVDDLNETGQISSIIETSRSKAVSFLFGPVRFVNHDCEANARLVTTGPSGTEVVATRDIGVGDEITVPYANTYFGEDNHDCLCKTCEDLCCNGWEENQNGSDDSRVRPPGDYEAPEWAHSCLNANGLRGDAMYSPCQVCKRHKDLFGYDWPKTQRSGRRDTAERDYSNVVT